MMRPQSVIARYTCAVHSRNLSSKPDTTASDSDVLGAAGLAGKRSPLAIDLARLLAGDNNASHDIVRRLSQMARDKADDNKIKIKLKRTQAADMARAVIAWHRHGTCPECQGRAYQMIPGTPHLSGVACPACRGTGKVPFDQGFAMERVALARWLQGVVERELSRAGSDVMAKLVVRKDEAAND